MPIVKLPKNTEVDIYAASGLPVGSWIIIQNVTPNDIRMSNTQSGLENDYVVVPLYQREANNITDTECWAKSKNGDGAVSVRFVI